MPVPDGTRVAVFLGAANRDERRYERPDDFDIARNPVDHVAFGNGLHTCVGAPLARLEITSVLRALLERARALSQLASWSARRTTPPAASRPLPSGGADPASKARNVSRTLPLTAREAASHTYHIK